MVKYKEYHSDHFDHSDFPVYLIFTFDVCCGSLELVSLGTQDQLQIILDPDYVPDYLLVSYNYDRTHYFKQYLGEPMCKI